MPILFTAKTEKLSGEFNTNSIMEALEYLSKVGGLRPANIIYAHSEFMKEQEEGKATIYGLSMVRTASLTWYRVDERLEGL